MPSTRSIARATGRLSAVAGALALAGALAVPAGAAGDTYAAASRADGVLVRIEGNQVSIASATAEADSTPVAAATGAGFFTPEHQEAGTSAEATEDGQQDADPEVCAQETPPEMPVVFGEGPCSSAEAAVQGGLPTATGRARGGEIAIGVSDLPIGDTPIGDAVDQIVEGLGPIFDGIGETGIDAETLFNDLLEAILEGDVVNIQSGVSSATVAEAADGRVTATGTIDGAVIGLFDRGEALGGPMLTITTGRSTASVTRTRATGQAVPTFEPAPVTITLAPDVLAALPPEFPQDPIALPPGQSACIPLPDPLESCVTAGGGSTETTDDGEVRAMAAAVRIDLLNGLPEGGITVALSNAEAAIAGTVPAAPTTSSSTTPPTGPAPTLPTTGPTVAWLPAAGWGLLGGAVVMGGLAGILARRGRER